MFKKKVYPGKRNEIFLKLKEIIEIRSQLVAIISFQPGKFIGVLPRKQDYAGTIFSTIIQIIAVIIVDTYI